MQDDMGSPDSPGEIEGPQGMPQPGSALEASPGRRLKKVRGCPVSLTGERAEIVDTSHLDEPFIHATENPRHEGHWYPVAQFDPQKPQFPHFREHRIPIGVAM